MSKTVPGRRAVLCCAAAGLALGGWDTLSAETNSPGNKLLSVKDVHGKSHQPLVQGGQKATALFFVLHDCPLARKCAPEINRIVADYAKHGVRSFLVYVEDDLSVRAARQNAKDFGYTCPVLLDRDQQLVRFTSVTTSPEVAVLSPDNAVLYRGRIDDRLVAFGKERVAPTRRDLREALDAIVAGKPVPNPVTQAVGCYLPLKEAGNP